MKGSLVRALVGLAAIVPSALAFPQAAYTSNNYGPASSSPPTGALSATPSSSLTTSRTASSTRSARTGPVTHTVAVGRADHKIEPDETFAEPGDTVRFEFYPANHSIVRAEYMHACIPWDKFHDGEDGMFFSQFKPVDKILQNPPSYSIVVNDTAPIFFYCSAPGSCINFLMVGAINPNSSQTVAAQIQDASKASYMLQPGEPFPAEGGPSSTVPQATPRPSGTASAGSSTSETPGASTGKSGLSSGAIAGIAVGGAVVLVLAALLFWLIGRNKSLSDTLKRSSATVRTTDNHLPGAGMSEPQPFQSGGTIFVPVKADTWRQSGMSSPPPGYQVQEADMGSPRMQSPRDTFADFGGAYQSPTQERHVSSLPPKETEAPTGPHEMYAPMPQRPNQP